MCRFLSSDDGHWLFTWAADDDDGDGPIGRAIGQFLIESVFAAAAASVGYNESGNLPLVMSDIIYIVSLLALALALSETHLV